MAAQEAKFDLDSPCIGTCGKTPADIENSEVVSERNSSSEANSIYPEVRAAVPAIDKDAPVNTIRVWLLGTVATVVMAGFTQMFGMHNPPLSLSSYIVILAAYPIGRFISQYTPRKSFQILGHKLELNPGPFSFKEHTVIAIMTIGSTGYDSGGLATYVWTAMVKDLDIPASTGFKLMFMLINQAMALGLAGTFQKLLVDPAYCIWPTALPTCTLIHGMHDGNFLRDVQTRWRISPMRFFWIAFIVVTAWQMFPGYIFTGLSYFAWVTWIVPDNVTVNQLFGAYGGMDLIPMTLDWNQIISYQSSPLVTPLWAVLNVLGGAVFFLWVLSPALHWSNIWYGKYFPFSSSSIFDNTGATYNTSRVLTPDYTLNVTAYEEYSPIYLSTTSAVSYGLGFASVASVLVHAALHYREEILIGWRKTFAWRKTVEADLQVDVHVRLMQKYRPAPTWWYMASLVVISALAIVFVECFDTGLPWWGVILSLAINLVLFVPVAILSAVCNQAVSTNVFAAFIGGYLWPGKIVAVVIFKCISFNPLGTGLVLARDQKLGHYMKIPPRVVFCAQALGIIINWLVQTGVNAWALGNVQGICTSDAVGKFTCPLSASFKASMVFWGLVGPARLFSEGALYRPMLWFFLVGFTLPIIIYALDKRFPKIGLKYLNVPLIMTSIGSIPPATAINFMAWGAVGIFFQWYLRRRALGWWTKYNFLLSAALDGGLALTSLIIFFAFSYSGVTFSWWGNNVDATTADYNGLALMTVPDGETFGLKTW